MTRCQAVVGDRRGWAVIPNGIMGFRKFVWAEGQRVNDQYLMTNSQRRKGSRIQGFEGSSSGGGESESDER